MAQAPKISEAEWSVMRVVWKSYPITVSQVAEALEEETGWKPKTVGTLIRRLVDKGALKYEKRGKAFYYTPAISEDRLLEAETNSFLSRFFGGSLNPMLAYLFEKEDLSPKQIDEIKQMISKLED